MGKTPFQMEEVICKWLEARIQFLVRMYGCTDVLSLVYLCLEIDILSFSDGRIYLQVVGNRNSILGTDLRMYGHLVTQQWLGFYEDFFL
ncbi:hypothetical protein KQX54_017324 [Cotesia glomerata]|uniref:Uncharacterized protein n=1 Tax=Cotesia glomerata TaxID=32391 RepID=A0AAV7IIX8_COTGL|nr:hypothetical protein KQX54_017324 [Cotesia glomerata]